MAANLLSKEGGRLANLLTLQSKMKCDPSGYEEELLLQLRHFEACLSVFQLHSSSKALSSSFANDQDASKELSDMVMFLAHVTPFYRQHLKSFPQQVLGLLQTMGDTLQPTLRRHLTQALILLRNRQMIELVEILPAFMELQTLGDRALRKLASLHIVQDIRRMNVKHRNESKNRQLQNVLFKLLQDDRESKSKRALIVLCELHRRKLWDDARTANAICAACFHPSSRILKASLGFLLGYEKMDEEDENSSEEDEEHNPVVAVSREDVYKAHHKGTTSSRKKKQAKLQRVVRSLKKQQRSQVQDSLGSSPLQHLHDPQSFGEKLFSRLQSSNERFEVKLMMMKVISRTIGLHRLIVLNFYAFLQRYVQPHQRDVTHVLAAAIQACHDMVPPDAVEPLLRQLVNQFVHDRARPEVIAVGLNAVREICTRMPLIMTRELLTDLALYKKSREKAVSSAARSIVAIFRQMYPSLLEKRDRGKGANILAKPKAFGEAVIQSNVPGIDLLANKLAEESDEFQSDSDNEDTDSKDEDEKFRSSSVDGADMEESQEEIEMTTSDSDAEDFTCGSDEEFAVDDDATGGDDDDDDNSDDDDDDNSDHNEDDDDNSDHNEDDDDGDDDSDDDGSNGDEADALATEDSLFCVADELKMRKRKGSNEGMESKSKMRKLGENDQIASQSLRELKRLLGNQNHENGQANDGILSDKDFHLIRKLQAKKVARDALVNAGMGKSKRNEEFLKIPDSEHIHERRVNPAMLEANIRKRREKEERIAAVRAGQEERDSYKARTLVKKKKSGGLSNRQKEKRKAMPLAAKLAKASKSRIQKNAKRRLTKQFRGKKAWK
ncbi:hypothetical protein KP509_37G033500 [Ceratopteris richardii]|uniref:Protein SDA1 n=1 Tax=Ceratopteris richardii TaxID=49495 RepID=A0A8T2Q7W5_CERRI|nr:hypothetical protein KP509_37G033500 [Ceratopteris richardii]